LLAQYESKKRGWPTSGRPFLLLMQKEREKKA
jgi:hypothetical protein